MMVRLKLNRKKNCVQAKYAYVYVFIEIDLHFVILGELISCLHFDRRCLQSVPYEIYLILIDVRES